MKFLKKLILPAFLLVFLPMFSYAKTVTLSNEEELSTGFVIATFFANWCPVCQSIIKPLEELSNQEKYKNIKFLTINIDKCKQATKPTICEHYKVELVPTFIFFKNGNEITRIPGLEKDQSFEQMMHDKIKTIYDIK